MDYCGPIGLPHSQFLGWSYDDQDKAIAWSLDRKSKCGTCGTVTSEWLDEEGRDREPPPYEAKTQICLGCQSLADKQNEIPEDRRSFTQVYFQPWSEPSWDPSS